MTEGRKGFYFELLELLEQDPEKRFYADNGKDLLRNKVYECAMKMDKDLIKLLLSNDRMKDKFFTDIDGTLVFDKTAFGWAINNKAFLQDSYTRFKNNIGLIDSKEQFIASKNDVVLSFPYKDCVLEGGQTKEDQKRGEIFYNELLAPDDVDRLLAPKVFTNVKRYTKDGEESITEFKDDDNLLIKGNNLLALSSILKRYEGRVKCIYIDPPYNTGNDSFNYNDNFNHSTWLTFMKNRLILAKQLLREDGFIFVQCDDFENSYIKVLLDEIFGQNNFRNNIYWHRTYAGKTVAKKLPWNTDTIILYSKNENTLLYPATANLSEKDIAAYNKDDGDGRGKYSTVSLQKTGGPGPETTYDYVDNTGRIWKCPAKGWRMKQSKLKALENDNRLYITDTTIREKYYLIERQEIGKQIDNFWSDIGNMNRVNDEVTSIVGQKPEMLIERILKLSTKENDVVLDFCFGSGTTGCVAHKMNRQWIGIEQMDYIHSITVERLKNVLNGEEGGISKAVNWQGGGSFVYCELKELNHKYIDEIQVADDNKLNDLYKEITGSEFISYKADINRLKESEQGFKELSTEDKRNFLIRVLDKNLLYVNYCDMEDEDLAVTEEEKAFARSFYGEGV